LEIDNGSSERFSAAAGPRVRVGLIPSSISPSPTIFYTKVYVLSISGLLLSHVSSVPFGVGTIKLTIPISKRSRDIGSTSNTEGKFTVRAARFTDLICLSSYSFHTLCLECMSNLVRDISSSLNSMVPWGWKDLVIWPRRRRELLFEI
jgi:hypothetical protein